MRKYITILLLTLVSASSAAAQDWTAMHALPPNTQVRIQDRRGGQAEGLLASIEDGGLLYAFLTHKAYGDSTWPVGQIAGHYVGSIGFGAFIDWRNKSHRTVYRAP
jgi:hypothetical protein